MKHTLCAAVLALAVTGLGSLVPAQVLPPPANTEVPVKIVVLFSSGVGYFEHIGPVRGEASTELRFKTNQINDILKSLLLQDTAGKVSSVVYPSQDPLAKTLKSFQIDITTNPSLADLLNQLRGAKVKITAGTETFSATILGLEKKPKAVEKGSIEVWQINLLKDGTIRSLLLDEVSKIDLEDPQLQEELTKALTALAQARDQDKKPVTINFLGQGERLVRIGYVVETPIWKTSYRLILGKDGEKSNLQGWAIVENQTDNDWKDVQLSLVSGRPISFIQELYQPLYIPRPLVQPELFASLRPQTYDAGMDLLKERVPAANAPAAPAQAARRLLRGAAGGGGVGGADGVGAEALGLREESRKSLASAELFERQIDPTASVASVASAAKIGELFQYTVGNVSLPRQRSAMIPIITDPIEVERLSIYNQSVLPKNPLNGARVKNTTQKHLLQGPITVLEASSYAGDARIDNLPPGQERLLSYGIDLQMLVNATKNKQEDSIQTGKIVKGVLQVSHKHVFTQEYIAENKADKDKTLIVEHPFRQGWKLLEPQTPLETTDALYRFKQSVPAGKSTGLTVKEEMVQWETIAILPSDFGVLDFYSRSGQIPQNVRTALAKAAAFKGQMTDYQRQVEQRKAEIAQIAQDQARIRENLKAVSDRGALRTRWLEKLDEQEKQIDGLSQKMEEAQKSFETARKQLEDYVSNLNVE
jgi:hypothetical protein